MSVSTAHYNSLPKVVTVFLCILLVDMMVLNLSSADKAVSDQRALCYRSVSAGTCSLPLAQHITKQICCCSRVGKAWGAGCDRCPLPGSGTVKSHPPTAPACIPIPPRDLAFHPSANLTVRIWFLLYLLKNYLTALNTFADIRCHM